MDTRTFDTLVRRLATAPSRRRLLRALAGGGLGALTAALGREPAAAQVCIAGLPCRNDPGRCGAMASNCCCCRSLAGTQCQIRTICATIGGTCIAAPTTTTTTSTTTTTPCP